MHIFDDTIIEIKEWFRQKKDEGKVRPYNILRQAETVLPLSEALDATSTNPPIILKEDTHLELGHPSVGSCSMALATHDPSLIEHGRITLVGPDIPETNEKKLPFAQIVLSCSEDDLPDKPFLMDRVLNRSAQTDGYMLRSMSGLIWARVSKEAARAGFSLQHLGLRLIVSLHKECPDITKSEIFFVTSSREEVSDLEVIVEAARNKIRKIDTFKRDEDGTYECTTGLDCNECDDKPVCDNIRDAIKIRKGDRIISFSRG